MEKIFFAQYVNAHWQEIDFSEFRPLLDALQTIVLAQESILFERIGWIASGSAAL